MKGGTSRICLVCARRPAKLLAADKVQVQVVHRLAAVPTIVYHHPVAVSVHLLLLTGDPVAHQKEMTEEL